MGLLDKITSVLGSGEGASGLMEQVLNLVNNPEAGGLTGLIEKFQNNGLGDIISSWVGTGANQPVSGEQITSALGGDKIREIASRLGISDSEAVSGLANMLPQVIDKLTPEGTVPEGGTLQESIGGLLKHFLNR